MYQDHLWALHCGGFWIFPMVMFVAMTIFFFMIFVKGKCRPPWGGSRGNNREDGETALEILKKRYASGEITKAEFEQIKNDILS